MKKQFLLVMAVLTLGLSGTVFATRNDEPEVAKPSICHPVNGNGELGNGWNLISPAQASSHIDESKYPDGEYWKHESKDGRHDQYAVNETCPSDQPYVPPKECPAGTTLVDYENDDKQKPICKGEPTGCPYGDSIPVDSPKCVPPKEDTPVVKSTTPTPVEDTVYPEFQGK